MEKPKILIVNDNMHIGGIQKSLYNLLVSLHNEYDITLLLINNAGSYLNDIPEDVRLIFANKLCSVFGASKSELKNKPFLFAWKGILKTLLRFTNKNLVLKIAFLFQKKIPDHDIAISFSHPCTKKDMRSCSAEFVLRKAAAKEKICYIHCDYKEPSVHDLYTDNILKDFDKIACCSDSVRKRFLSCLPEFEHKTYTARNFFDLSIVKQTGKSEDIFDDAFINIVSLARLSTEKGLDRAIQAIYDCKRDDIKYFIIGDGPKRQALEELITSLDLKSKVFLLGEKSYPYPYVKNADYLFVPSYHEAAPIVFDEAKVLGVKVITTDTVSAKEMITEEYGIVCGNSNEGITKALSKLRKEKHCLSAESNNNMQKEQFKTLIRGSE